MKRVILVILCLVLAAAGFVIGYFTRPIPPAPPAPAAAAEADPPKEPNFEITEEKGPGGWDNSPLVDLMGVSKIWRYQHGPAWIHVEYFVDFEQDGVKKRAFFQAFNIGDDDSQGTQWARAVQASDTDGYYDLAESQGAIVLDKDLGLRTERIYQVSGHDPKEGTITSGSFHGDSSWDVFEWYQQASTEPPPALVLDYDQCEKYTRGLFHGGKEPFLGSASGMGLALISSKGSYAGRDGGVVLSLQILAMPRKAAATEETAEAEVAELRRELAATPDGAEVKGKLARAIDYKRLLLKERTPETDYALAEEAVNLLREAAKQAPGNMMLRAELRKLLLRQAALMTEGKHASEFPKTLEETESLVPLYDAEYTDAAALLVKWKNPELDKDLPENDKKRITQETDAKVVKLLRRHAVIWQNRPDEIKKKLDLYESQAKGQNYATTPEFKGLLEEMRGWVKKKD